MHGYGFLPDMLSRDDQEACGVRAVQPDRQGMVVVNYNYSGGMSIGGCRTAARSAYEKVLQKDPASAEARLRRGGLIAVGFDPERAGGLTEDRRVTYLAGLFRGLVAEKRKDLVAARARYEEARALGPEWQSARLALGSVWLQEGRVASARELLPLEVRPDDSDPWYGYACRIMTPDVLSELREWQKKQRVP
jgi:hypothetical protein